MTDDIDFDDVPVTKTPKEKKEKAVLHLPQHLREQALRLPEGQQHTVLTLKPEGEGHNASLLTTASLCFKMGVSFDDALDHLQALYSPDRQDYDTAPQRACVRAYAAEGDLDKLTDGDAEANPDPQEELLIRFRRTPQSSIIEASPAPTSVERIDILNRLFKEDDIINIQHTALEYGTLVKLQDLPKYLKAHGTPLDHYKFLNPATFKKAEGIENPLQNGKVSTRCNANVKARDWMVLEMDDPDIAKQERFNTFALTMAQYAPLILAVDTGGKSIHYWFDASGVATPVRQAFFALACLHGADKRLAVKSQIARMPGVSSADEGRGPQDVIYWDPEEKEAAGWDLPAFEAFLQQHQQLDYYYLGGKAKSYMTRDNLDSWIHLDRTSLRCHLAEQGYRENKLDGETISPIDTIINFIQMDRNVEAVLPGASGRYAGVYEENGHRVIVTKNPEFIKPRRGQWPTIHRFLSGLVGHTPDQMEVLFAWLADGCIKPLRNDGKRSARWCPCQKLFLIGPNNAGKTLFTKDILAPCLANRQSSADPLFKKFPDMHNPDTFACELLILDDTHVLTTDYASRQEYGERIKSHVVGMTGGMRDMHQGRINMRPWWRFIRLMNDQPATLATLPPFDEGMADKFIILRGEDMQKGPMAEETKEGGWYDRVKPMVDAELPAFIHFLLHEFKCPDHLKDPQQRYPVISFKEAQIMRDIQEGSAESGLLYKIDHEAVGDLFGEGMFDTGDGGLTPWEGPAHALWDILAGAGSRSSQRRFAKMCPNERILLSQLRTLEKDYPDRVGYSRRLDGYPNKKKGVEYWVLFPKEAEVDEELEALL